MSQAKENPFKSKSRKFAKTIMDVLHLSQKSDSAPRRSVLHKSRRQENHRNDVQCLEAGGPSDSTGSDTRTNQNEDRVSLPMIQATPSISSSIEETTPQSAGELHRHQENHLDNAQCLEPEAPNGPSSGRRTNQNKDPLSFLMIGAMSSSASFIRETTKEDTESVFDYSPSNCRVRCCAPHSLGSRSPQACSFILFDEDSGRQESRGPNHSTGGTGASPGCGSGMVTGTSSVLDWVPFLPSRTQPDASGVGYQRNSPVPQNPRHEFLRKPPANLNNGPRKNFHQLEYKVNSPMRGAEVPETVETRRRHILESPPDSSNVHISGPFKTPRATATSGENMSGRSIDSLGRGLKRGREDRSATVVEGSQPPEQAKANQQEAAMDVNADQM
ncbi:hypothetical protein FRC20_004849, partial [Serendipita sp. 405]